MIEDEPQEMFLIDWADTLAVIPEQRVPDVGLDYCTGIDNVSIEFIFDCSPIYHGLIKTDLFNAIYYSYSLN